MRGGGALFMSRKLEKDVSISELLNMRADGMTNHQIAQHLGVSDTTIYRYIGKRSFAVVNAMAQNKPCPIKNESCIEPGRFFKTMPDDVVFVGYQQSNNDESTEEDEQTMSVKPDGEPKSVAGMAVLRVCHVYDLKGSLCTFHVNTGEGTVEMTAEGGSLITGMLDRHTIPEFVAELQSVLSMMSENR